MIFCKKPRKARDLAQKTGLTLLAKAKFSWKIIMV